MYKLSKLRKKKTREEILKMYRENPSSFFRLNQKEIKEVKGSISDFCKGYLEKSGLDGYVVGLSGGLDSSVVASLLTKSVSRERVTGVVLPSGATPGEDVEDAQELADRLGIKTHIPENCRDKMENLCNELEEMGIKDANPGRQKVKRGNIICRARMIVLRDVAKAGNSLVAGTTNASERLTGYFTLGGDGDGGVDIEVIYGLFKSTVMNLAPDLNISEKIVNKKPSARLWRGQTDEGELGVPWRKIDLILLGYELKATDLMISDVADVEIEKVEKIKRRIDETRFKRQPVPYPDL